MVKRNTLLAVAVSVAFSCSVQPGIDYSVCMSAEWNATSRGAETTLHRTIDVAFTNSELAYVTRRFDAVELEEASVEVLSTGDTNRARRVSLQVEVGAADGGAPVVLAQYADLPVTRGSKADLMLTAAGKALVRGELQSGQSSFKTYVVGAFDSVPVDAKLLVRLRVRASVAGGGTPKDLGCVAIGVSPAGPMPSCTPNPCKNSGVCQLAGNALVCQCPRGFSGALCEFEGTCNRMNCGRGTCVDSTDGGYCICAQGSVFTGSTCACPPGRNGPQCQLEGTCEVVEQTGCGPDQVCRAAWMTSGVFDAGVSARQTFCARTDGGGAADGQPCSLHDCRPGSGCSAGTTQFGVCGKWCNLSAPQCPAGTICQPDEWNDGVFGVCVAPCRLLVCQNSGQCVATEDGGQSCQCRPGFTGSLCQTCGLACQNMGQCTANLDGGAACACPSGFSGALCETCGLTCQHGGQCAVSAGGATCNCPTGFWGTTCENEGQCDLIRQTGCMAGTGCAVDLLWFFMTGTRKTICSSTSQSLPTQGQLCATAPPAQDFCTAGLGCSLPNGVGQFCGQWCVKTDAGCPSGLSCRDEALFPGDPYGVCVP